MNDCKPVNDVYQEIINRFFHPQSYFFICLRYYLENLSLIRQGVTAATSRLLVQFIEFLSQSNPPAQALQEISHLSGFDRLYDDIEQQLEQMNFRSLLPSQLRKTIQELARTTLNRLVEILATNQSACQNLTSYLEIRLKLQALLAGVGSAQPLLPFAPVLDMSEQDAQPEFATPSGTAVVTPPSRTMPSATDPPSTDDSLARFKQEVARLLKPFVIYSADAATQHHFIQRAQECFEEIEDLAMYHGFEEVEAIAGKVARMMELVQEHKMPLDSQAIGFFYDAKAAIEKTVFHQRSIDNLKESLTSMDSYLLSLEQHASPGNQQLNESPAAVELGRQITVSRAIGSIEKSLPRDEVEGTIPDRLPNITNSLANDYRGEDDMMPLPAVAGEVSDVAVSEIRLGELIDHTGGNGGFSGDTLMVMSTDHSGTTLAQHKAETVPEELPRNGCDQFYSTIFIQEAARYFRLIAQATNQLKGEGNAQMYLEDIELASSAIKQLAQKFGLEKIALLPEIIEAISWQANRSNVRVSLPALEFIEAGISLLQAFDPQDAAHNLQFDQILSSLKEYYAKTFASNKTAATV
ncbi:MAG: hypothetical protein ONB27_08080 [candidate division KSB1 bacterium]|nr:hypothetical protein [candidate division KSB1 bacterium]